MKNFFSIMMVAMMAISMTFVSCNKDDKGSDGPGPSGTCVIEAKNVEDGSSEIATVKAITSTGYEIATAEYKNGGFKLTLSGNVPDEYLTKATTAWGIPEDMLSDKNVKIAEVELYAYNSSGKKIGYFGWEDYNWDVSYGYVDRDFTVSDGGSFSVKFKKGWVATYESDDDFTIQKPSDLEIQWYYVGEGGPEPGDDTQVRFKKEKSHPYVLAMSVDEDGGEELVSYEFGTNSGTSEYFTIPAGKHIAWFYLANLEEYEIEEDWYCFKDLTPYNFKAGRKYTVICAGSDVESLEFDIIDDGTFKSAPIHGWMSPKENPAKIEQKSIKISELSKAVIRKNQ